MGGKLLKLFGAAVECLVSLLKTYLKTEVKHFLQCAILTKIYAVVSNFSHSVDFFGISVFEENHSYLGFFQKQSIIFIASNIFLIPFFD